MARLKITLNNNILERVERGELSIELTNNLAQEIITEGGDKWIRLPDKEHKSIEIRTNDITYIKSDGDKLLKIYTITGEEYHKSVSLASFIADLGNSNIQKVHDSHAVNLDNVCLVAILISPRKFRIKIKNTTYDIPIGKKEEYTAFAEKIKQGKSEIISLSK